MTSRHQAQLPPCPAIQVDPAIASSLTDAENWRESCDSTHPEDGVHQAVRALLKPTRRETFLDSFFRYRNSLHSCNTILRPDHSRRSSRSWFDIESE